MEIINNIIETTLKSFDFSFCIVVNILTYIIISSINAYKKTNISIWYKRIILFVSIVVISLAYYFMNMDVKLIINSAILAPVFWSWIIKPICAKFNIDYKKIM